MNQIGFSNSLHYNELSKKRKEILLKAHWSYLFDFPVKVNDKIWVDRKFIAFHLGIQ